MRLLVCTQKVDKRDPILGFFHEWLAELAERCESVVVLCLEKGAYSLPGNVAVHSLLKETNPTGKLGYALRFWKVLGKIRGQYDTVLVHMNPEYALLGAPRWKLTHTPVALWYTHKSVPLWLRLALPFVDTVFTASRESFRIPCDKVRVVGHGIDTERFTPMPRRREALEIITVGRISESKRIMEMFAVLDALARRGVAFTFHVVGDTVTREDKAYKERIDEMMREWPYRDRVRFLGPRTHEELPNVLRDASVFLHMSTTGSVDKAVLEALSCGVPVVTSSAAFKDYPVACIEDGDPEKMAEAITSARAADPSVLRSYVIEHHGLKRLVSALISALGEV